METPYEIRKAMLECMDEKEIRSMLRNKEKEAKEIRVEEYKLPLLDAFSDWLKLPFDMVHNSYLAECRSNITELCDILSKELKKRKNPESQIDLNELKASVPIAQVVRYYIPSYGMRRWASSNIQCCFHEDRTASLHIYEKTNTFKCFGCNAWWTAIDFIMKSDKVWTREAILKLKTFV